MNQTTNERQALLRQEIRERQFERDRAVKDEILKKDKIKKKVSNIFQKIITTKFVSFITVFIYLIILSIFRKDISERKKKNNRFLD